MICNVNHLTGFYIITKTLDLNWLKLNSYLISKLPGIWLVFYIEKGSFPNFAVGFVMISGGTEIHKSV